MFEKTFPKRLEGEDEDYYCLFMLYLEKPELQDLALSGAYGLMPAEIYSIAVKYKWSERFEKYNASQAEVKRNDRMRILKVSYETTIDNYIMIYDHTKKMMKQFFSDIPTDLYYLKKYEGMDIDSQIKRISNYNKVVKGFILTIRRLEAYLESVGLGRKEIEKNEFMNDIDEAVEVVNLMNIIKIDVNKIPDADELRKSVREEQDEINQSNLIEQSEGNIESMETDEYEEDSEEDFYDSEEDIAVYKRMGIPFSQKMFG